MATHTFTQEFHTSIAPEKAFKSFILDGANNIPKAIPHVVKSVEREAGRILKINLADGGQLKVKVDTLDTRNKICKFSVIQGGILSNTMESMTFEEKYEPSSNGGSVLKVKGEFRPKAGSNYTAAAQDDVQAMSVFKATEAFILANPTI